MIKWNDIPLKTKLISLFLILSIVPLSIVGYMSYNNAKQSLESEAIAKLDAVGGLKESRISSYFEERQGDALVLSEMGVFNIMKAQSNLEAVAQIKSNQMESYFGERQGDAEALAEMGVFNIRNAKDNLQAIGQIKSNQIESYFGERLGDVYVLSQMPVVKSNIEERNNDVESELVNENALVEYEKAYGYYDLFLIGSDGSIFYTVEKESDFGQNLFSGSLSDTNLAKVAREAMRTGEPVLSDFAYYAPSNGFAAFLAAPASGGVVALQINTEQINSIMQERTGLGESGETYLVSTDDKLMRSDSRFETESTILRNKIDTEAVSGASDEWHVGVYADYRGVPVVGAYKMLDIEGLNWAMIAEIDQLEALTPQTEKGDYFTTYTNVYGYYDLFLINPDGHIFFTVGKESDLGTNLIDGQYKDSNLGMLFRSVSASRAIEISDLESYEPSGGIPAGFIAAPIIIDGELESVVALQINLDQINGIMQERTGLGETGETYLVSLEDNLMRSDSRFETESTILRKEINTEATQKASDEFQLSVYPDYRGVPVVGAYMTLDIKGVNWVMIAEIDELEALTPVTEKGDYFKTYTDVYGYYDLFLINPDGHIFYTVAKESDYGTNLITGEYRDSNLGALFRSVSASGRVEISDIEPYAPSGDAPAGFIAAPVFIDGNLESVVALQIATGQIDAIMQQAEGMGESGESYLVGRDLLFRSNSRLTTEDTLLQVEVNTKGVQESFRIKGEFDGIYGDYTTKAEAEAQTGREYSDELGGVPVLGSVLYLQELDWVLVNEIDTSEAFAPVTAMRNQIVMVAIIAAIAVAVLAFLVAMSIIRPISRIGDEAKKLAETGDLNTRATVSGKDEIGQMAEALNNMLDNVAKPVKEMARIADAMAKGDLTEQITVKAKGDINVLVDGFKAMVGSLTGLIVQVKGSASTVSATSQELAASSEEMNATTEQVTSTVTQIASGAQSQAQQVESASSEMKSLSEMVHQISSSAQSATEMSDKTNELAQSGGEAAENASAKMKEVYTEVKSSADVVGELGEKSEKIGNIVNVITDIAEQTNLLALNAAIEAARAGDHGRGFAVVAEEVRKLAENSAKAAEQISVLIKDIQTNTDKAVKSIDKGTKEVAEGTEVVEKAMAAFEEIVTSVGEVAGKVQEISAATQEQTAAVETVVKGIDSIASAAEEAAAGTEEASAATEEQTASMEEMTASAQELANLADELQEAVSVFKLAEGAEADVGGNVKRKIVEHEPIKKGEKSKAKVSRQKAGVKANGPKKARVEVKKISSEPVEAGAAVGEN